MGYFKQTFKGLSWMGSLRILSRLISFIRIGILARLLDPVQFGLFGIAALVLSLLETLTETGINVFFIQKEGLLDEYVSTAWIVSIIRGFVIFLFIFIGAPFIAVFFNSPDSVILIKLIGVVPLIRGFVNPSEVRYRTTLDFKKEFILQFSFFAFDSVTAIIFGFILHSAMCMVLGLLASAILEVFITLLYIKPRPKLNLDKFKLKRIINRGRWVTAYGLFNYSFENLDDAVVGKILNTDFLGLYQVAYKISTLPITEIAQVFSPVTLPVFVNIASDKKRLLNAYKKTMLMIVLLSLPFAFAFIVFPDFIIKLVLGDKWISAVYILKALAIFGVLRAIINYGYSIFLAKKKQEYVTVITLSALVGMGLTIIPFIYKYGVLGAAYAEIFGTLVSIPFFIYLLRNLIKNFDI